MQEAEGAASKESYCCAGRVSNTAEVQHSGIGKELELQIWLSGQMASVMRHATHLIGSFCLFRLAGLRVDWQLRHATNNQKWLPHKASGIETHEISSM